MEDAPPAHVGKGGDHEHRDQNRSDAGCELGAAVQWRLVPAFERTPYELFAGTADLTKARLLVLEGGAQVIWPVVHHRASSAGSGRSRWQARKILPFAADAEFP